MNSRLKSSHDEMIRRAQRALDDERFDEAEAQGRRALMRQPESLDARQVIASSLIEQARFEEAVVLLEEIVAVDTDDLAALADIGLCLFEMCRFEEAETFLGRALEVDPTDPQACYWMALCVERHGPSKYGLAEELFRQAHATDPEAYPLPTRIPEREFARIVEQAIEELPGPARAYVRGGTLSIHVPDLPHEEHLFAFDPPADPCLFGLYTGIPLPERSHDQSGRLPDWICIYKRNLERMFHDRDELIEEIRITVLHELGHYLGFDEEELEGRGLA